MSSWRLDFSHAKHHDNGPEISALFSRLPLLCVESSPEVNPPWLTIYGTIHYFQRCGNEPSGPVERGETPSATLRTKSSGLGVSG